MQRADLIAAASAIRGDPTGESIVDPVIGVSIPEPENIQASPAASLSLLHAASVLHITRLLTAGGCGGSFGRKGCLLVSSVDWWRPSKRSIFLAFQIAQIIQGRTLRAIPEGGRHTALLNLTTASEKVESVVMLIALLRGISSQTCLAYWQIRS